MIAGLVLAPDVHAVIADERAVFLDVNHDRYFKLGAAQTRMLGEQSPARDRLVGQLSTRGLFVNNRSDFASRADARRPQSKLSTGASVLSVLGACHWASRSLATRVFADVLGWARDHRPVRAPVRSELCSYFLARRPFYARDYNCLFDSLALIRFLRLREAAGEWVFGVRAMPFAAHCWVAIDGACVNDDPEFVAPYTQILVV